MPAPMDYAAPPPGPTRGQFRVLLVLTFMNTVLLGLYVLGPQLIEAGKSQWAAYQKRQADAADAAAKRQVRVTTAAGQAACLAYDPGPDRLVYAEDVEGVRRLRQAGGRDVGTGTAPPSPDGVRPAAAENPPCVKAADLSSLAALTGPVVFVHGRDAGRGPRLVVVTVSSARVPESTDDASDPGKRVVNYAANARRTLTARAVVPGTADRAASPYPATEVALVTTADESTLRTQIRTPGLPSAWTADYKNELRLLAGRADPADATRFEVPYAIDGTRGRVVGRLLPSNAVTLTVEGPLDEWRTGGSTRSAPSPRSRVATGRPATRPGP